MPNLQFQKLDRILNQGIPMNTWYSSGLFETFEIVKYFKQEDWKELQSSWILKEEEWQYRCSEVLNWADEKYAIPLLIEIVLKASDRVALAAADSLRGYSLSKTEFLQITGRLHILALSSRMAEIIIELIEEDLYD